MGKLAERVAEEFNNITETIIRDELKDEKALQLVIIAGVPLIAISLANLADILSEISLTLKEIEGSL